MDRVLTALTARVSAKCQQPQSYGYLLLFSSSRSHRKQASSRAGRGYMDQIFNLWRLLECDLALRFWTSSMLIIAPCQRTMRRRFNTRWTTWQLRNPDTPCFAPSKCAVYILIAVILSSAKCISDYLHFAVLALHSACQTNNVYILWGLQFSRSGMTSVQLFITYNGEYSRGMNPMSNRHSVLRRVEGNIRVRISI